MGRPLSALYYAGSLEGVFSGQAVPVMGQPVLIKNGPSYGPLRLLMMKMLGNSRTGFSGVDSSGMNGLVPLMLMSSTGLDDLFGGMFEEEEEVEE